MSRDKGKRGEREVAHLFRQNSYTARRTAQVDGGLTADVLVEELPRLHVEVKRRPKIGVSRFMDQAHADAALRATPVVFHREDQKDWQVTMRADTFFLLLQYARSAEPRLYTSTGRRMTNV